MRFGSKYCTQFPELAELFVLKSRTETDASKKDGVIFVLISRTNFSRNFVRVLCATVRDFSAVIMQSNPGNELKQTSVNPGFECSMTAAMNVREDFHAEGGFSASTA
jgi:hypothetical protein